MSSRASGGVGRLLAFGVLSAGVLVAALQHASRAADDSGGQVTQPLAKLFTVAKSGGYKFESANSCSAAACHGGAAPERGKPIGFIAAFTIYSDKDKHAGAFDTLSKDKSKAIADKLKIADATTSSRCLSCHAIDISASPDLVASGNDAYKTSEGVSCDACHGPSSKWHQTHAAKGWTNEQRKAAGYQLEELPPGVTVATDEELTSGKQQKLLEQQGLYDTKPLLARGETCTKCHLAIDADMVDAGHPQPVFELVYYQTKEPKHWTDPEGYFVTKTWSAGQVVALREAMKQLSDRAVGANVSADRLKEAYELAMSHYSMVDALFASGAIKGDQAALEKAGDVIKGANMDKPKMAVAAADIAKMFDNLAKGVEGFKPDKDATVKIIGKVADEATIAKDYGRSAAQQQTYALYFLSNAVAATEKSKAPNFKALTTAYVQKPEDKDKGLDAGFDADQYSAALSAVKDQLPK